MKLENLDFVQPLHKGTVLLGQGFRAKVTCSGKSFEISVFVSEGYLVAAYANIASDMLTHFKGTNFTVDATGDIIDLLNEDTWITKLNPVPYNDHANFELQFKNMTVPIRVYPSGGVEIVPAEETKTGIFS